MKGTVLVQIKWADPRRRGLRTLALSDTTLNAVYRRLSRDVANGSFPKGLEEVSVLSEELPEVSPRRAHARLLWSDATAPADPDGDSYSLFYVQIGDRRILVKVAGRESIPDGSDVLIDQLPAWGTLFEGTVSRATNSYPLIAVMTPPLQ